MWGNPVPRVRQPSLALAIPFPHSGHSEGMEGSQIGPLGSGVRLGHTGCHLGLVQPWAQR